MSFHCCSFYSIICCTYYYYYYHYVSTSLFFCFWWTHSVSLYFVLTVDPWFILGIHVLLTVQHMKNNQIILLISSDSSIILHSFHQRQRNEERQFTCTVHINIYNNNSARTTTYTPIYTLHNIHTEKGHEMDNGPVPMNLLLMPYMNK